MDNVIKTPFSFDVLSLIQLHIFDCYNFCVRFKSLGICEILFYHFAMIGIILISKNGTLISQYVNYIKMSDILSIYRQKFKYFIGRLSRKIEKMRAKIRLGKSLRCIGCRQDDLIKIPACLKTRISSYQTKFLSIFVQS